MKISNSFFIFIIGIASVERTPFRSSIRKANLGLKVSRLTSISNFFA